MTSCHECRERLKPPVVLLPCNHNLCQVCCQKIFDNKSLPIKNSRNGGRRIRCPACRYEVVLDMHGVHSLPRNLVIEQIIEKMDLWQADLKKGKVVPKKSWQKKYVTKKPPYRIPKCKVGDHSNQNLNIYCRTCQVLTCTLCKCFGAHQKCHVIPLSEAHQEDLYCLKALLKKLRVALDRYTAVINIYNEFIQIRKDHMVESKMKTIETFQKYENTLQERKDAMQKFSSEDVNSRTKILDEYLDKCGAVLMEQTEITSEAMRVMGAKNWVGFIARARDEMTPKILDFCNRREEFTNIKLPDAIDDNEHLQLDLDNVFKILQKINFND